MRSTPIEPTRERRECGGRHSVLRSDRRSAARRATLGAALLAAGLAMAGTAHRVDAACASPVNPDATAPDLRNQVSGTWYSENQQMGMTQRMYQTFSPNGLFEYRDQTCSNNMPGLPCSQNYGHGTWNAARQRDGSIYIRVQFSDQRRSNDCTGWVASFPDPQTMAMNNGGMARRVR